MSKRDAVSKVDIIIDYPAYVKLHDVAENLKHTRINGHQVLAVVLTDPRTYDRTYDYVEIPHPGHSVKCEKKPHECMRLSDNRGESSRYRRFFNMQLIVDGAFHIADMDNLTFRWSGSTMIMVSCVSVIPTPDYKYDLSPWEERV